MIYLKKIIAQDLDRTPTFSQDAWEFFFKLPLDNEKKTQISFINENDNKKFDLSAQRRATRNEIRAFIKPIFDEYDVKLGDLLIFKKNQSSNTFVFSIVIKSENIYKKLSTLCQGKNHQIIISENFDDQAESIERNNHQLNTILYGPAGTGKTYTTIERAVEVIDGCIEGKERIQITDRFKKLKENNQISFITFHQSFSYEEFVEGISVTTDASTKKTEYKIKDGILKLIAKEAQNNPTKNYVLIIDEINRGNVSKVFGELITLLEPSKRLGNDEELTVKLPYTQQEFGIPNNLYIIGTMNSSDRSLTTLDIAIRRRFKFEELLPNIELFKDLKIDSIEIHPLLDSINERIEYLIGRDYCIGHAYFTLLLDTKNQTFENLSKIFKNQILPLLEEYFYSDWEKIDLVLGSNHFLEKKEFKGKSRNLFERKSLMSEDIWVINPNQLNKVENYRLIYSDLEFENLEEVSLE